ncbi:MAG: OmpA family protein [Deltaproteobacteria bacterium]|nr:OmpA family protein [Deltaproteobacteria bacterium]
MKKITTAFLFALLTLSLVGTAFAAAPSKIKSFDLLVDYSMSMGWNYKNTGTDRIVLAQELLEKINARIPGENYTAGLHTFAPMTTAVDFGSYNRGNMQNAIDELSGNFVRDASKLSQGSGLDFFAHNYSDLSRPGAIVSFTDGDYGAGRNSINEAQIFYQTQPNMCLHFVSFANTEKEQALIDAMAALNPCSVSVKAEDLLASDAAIDSFVEQVWGAGGGHSRVVMSANDVHFAFDSNVIHESQKRVANVVLRDLADDSDLKVRIDGYTCNIGPADYNQDLSVRRANAVKNYLVDNGISASRIVTKGHGPENPVADNNTRDGRAQNRRVEFTFFK